MEFAFRRIETLPRLAWCAEIAKGSSIAEVYHGPWVETRDTFFVDGAWDAPFTEGAFDRSYLFMGTGGKIQGDRILFCSPCHTLERVYVLKTKDRLFLSPSLTFLLVRSGRNLDIDHIPYQAELLAMLRQRENHIADFPLDSSETYQVYLYQNLAIDSDLNITPQQKADPPEFKDFQDYRKFLVSGTEALFRNATDEARQVRYEPLGTISTGYDSPCTSALAAEVGCREAVTFHTARPDGRGGAALNDSGREIANVLGLTLREYDRLNYQKRQDLPETEFMATGDLGQDVSMSTLEEEFEGRFVVTGVNGDGVWDRQMGPYQLPPSSKYNLKVQRNIVRPDAGLCSLAEFRYRTGFFHLPMPFMGCLSVPSLNRISNSEEMKPWRTNTKYDRPIPRRILEEKGVDGNLFGRQKKATTVLLNRHREILNMLSPESAKSFEAFYQRHRTRRCKLTQLVYNLWYQIFQLYILIAPKIHGGFRRLHIPFEIPCPVPARFRQPPGRPSFLVHWGISQIRSRYEFSESSLTGQGEEKTKHEPVSFSS